MKKLDIYLANLAVGNIKLHNLHWNVQGFAFKAVHEWLEGLYDKAFEYYDEVAELQKMQGQCPNASMKSYLELSTIEELESKPICECGAIKKALEYTKDMKKLALEIRDEADKEGNFAVVNMMEDHVAAYSKDIWFMESMIANCEKK